MRRPGTWLVLLFLVSFGVGMLPALPLAAVLRFLPQAVACTGPSGRVLDGHCQDLSLRLASGPVSLGQADWQWRPGRLFRGRLAVDASLRRGTAQAVALVQFTVGRIEVLDLQASGPLDALMLRAAPPGWTGQLEARGLRLRWQQGRLTALDGELTAQALRSAQGVDWGSYRLHIPRLPGGGLAPGTLQSLDGPVQLRGTLQITADRSWQLDAKAAAKPGTPPGIGAALSALGPADAAGQHPLSVAGSF